jgi:hypothetical protein
MRIGPGKIGSGGHWGALAGNAAGKSPLHRRSRAQNAADKTPPAGKTKNNKKPDANSRASSPSEF